MFKYKRKLINSILGALASLVEVFKEGALVGKLHLLVIAESFVACISALTNWHNLVEEMTTPDIAVLHVVETIVAACDEAVDLPWVAHLVMLAPVAS